MAVPPSPNFSAHEGEVERLEQLLKQGDLLMVSDTQQAETLLQEALTLARQLGDQAREAEATLLLGATFSVRSQFRTAIDLLHQAQALAEQANTPAILSRIANNLGICTVSLGEYGRAMEYYQRSLTIAQEFHDQAAVARALNNVGLVYTELGDYQMALDTYKKVRELTNAEGQGLQLIYLSATINTVRLYEHLGRLHEALELGATLLPSIQELGYRQLEVVLRAWTLPCLIGTGRAAEAVQEAEELLPLAQQVDDHEHLFYVRLFLGKGLLALGQLEEAQKPLEEALDEARVHDILPLRQKALTALSDLYAAQGKWQAAYARLTESHQLDQTLRDEALKRKGQVLGVQMRLEFLKQEAETERRRSRELTQANAELEAVQQQLAYRATHDPLTGLANRTRFQAEVERALQNAGTFGLLFIDLDRFKQVNDTLGHEVGDELLREISRRLHDIVRSGDLVARMGGDEFTIILRSLREAQDAELVAHKILNRLAQPLHLRGHTLHITGSIGVAVAPRDGQDVETLQKHADIAMYRAKRAGKNGVQIFQPVMSQETAERVSLERDLRLALAENQLVLHYQGQFSARSGNLSGFEALVRWQHPSQGLLFPGKFIDVAEESGLILPLGEWVLFEACRQAVAWDAPRRGFTISVNVSAVQFEQPDFLQSVQRSLETSGLPAQYLVLELTESVLMENHAEAQKKISQLKAMGVQLSLDDFGTGYSSLGLLQNLQFDRLKIDSSFVRDNQMKSDRARALVEFLIALAHRLEMWVTAEGVETEEQHRTLCELNCDEIQGFLLSRPEPVEQAERRLELLGLKKEEQ